MRLVVFAVSAMLIAPQAIAQDYRGVGFTGASVGDGAGGYAGAVVALPGGRLGEGWALRASASGGEFRYEADGRRIEATYIGGEAAAVYQSSGGWGWNNVSVGPRLTRLTLSPNDPGNERRGTRWDIGVQTDGALNLSPDWRLGYFGSVGVIDGAYLTRVNVARLVDVERQTRVGIEGGVQGDPRFTTLSAGALVASRVARNLDAQLSAGVLDQKGRAPRPYASLGLSVLF